jgi:rhodanese-related sulfurtransferase
MTVQQIHVLDLKQKLNDAPTLLLLDVREQGEYDYAHIEGSVLIPLNEIPRRMDELDKEQEVAVICHHGMRSLQVAYFLVQQGFKTILNVNGGIDAWSLECDTSIKRY